MRDQMPEIAVATSPPDPLADEMATYEQLLPSLSVEEGRFAVITGKKLIGIYSAYEDAVEAGYKACGLNPFLVKEIATSEVLPFIDRDVAGL